jgi:hypothetical protein
MMPAMVVVKMVTTTMKAFLAMAMALAMTVLHP